MTLWQNLNTSERIAAVQTTATNKNIEDRAVEKDWWVTAVLKALFSLLMVEKVQITSPASCTPSG